MLTSGLPLSAMAQRSLWTSEPLQNGPMWASLTSQHVAVKWDLFSKRVTQIHREPGPEGYGSVVKVTAKRRVEPLAAPSLGLCLGDLRTE